MRGILRAPPRVTSVDGNFWLSVPVDQRSGGHADCDGQDREGYPDLAGHAPGPGHRPAQSRLPGSVWAGLGCGEGYLRCRTERGEHLRDCVIVSTR